ncbi:MAG: small basic family protein [Clostridia bacterium]|nr:small basic family protein [Clostridia bacterium]MDD4146361.1 small basic family protein [Clostridia bacterium]MDD4665803.1 small basic family protein [Clostridia bacterium]
MWFLLPVLGLIIGTYLGSNITFQLPPIYIKYMSIAVLASLDSVFGGIKAILEDTFDGTILLSGFFTNALLAALLAYLGDRLGVDLYYAAVFAFGIRIFQNLAAIRHHSLTKYRQRKARIRGERNG